MWLTKMHSPPAERNKEPIWKILQEKVFSKEMRTDSEKWQILEVAGGAGVHTAHLVMRLADWNKKPFHWQSTDPEKDSRASQVAYMEEDITSSFQEYVSKTPLSLTLSSDGVVEPETRSLVQSSSLDLIVNINMIHISPWEATVGLMKLAKESLKVGGILYLYGPYKQNGTTAASNLKFDQFLQAKDSCFGIRNLEDVLALAKSEGLELVSITEMPANNLSVILRLKEGV
eukprot:CAMPEP_0198151574 /NCGR_PEP_ID=MMETSP1443-20131203/56131_1 /TAXON_ID=186043 /ORGANISM="Entomoneis sp., Strain CCMP2396" /LENGTH=229 /DNA_ID=CAMNT_0043817291 /DNA_START=236 /DNA_END=925 /DNA_ORIENTATION=-